MGGLILLALFFLFLLLGVRIALSLGLSSLIYFLIFMPQVKLTTIPQKMFTAVDNTALIAIPLFILAGELMNSGGISRRLIHFATTMVGHVRSGLSMVAVLACKFFGGITGSAIADTAAIGSVIIPAMAEKGYKRSYAAALLASAGSIGPIIPPSIPMVVYGSIAGVSIGKLFMGGYIPGILIGISLMITCYFIGKRQGHPKEKKATLLERWNSFKDAILALITPLIIMGGIVGGIVTPTEAGVIGVIYALIVGLFIYREIKWRDLPKIFLDTVATSGVVILVMTTAAVFGWILAYEQIPQMIAEAFVNFSDNKYVILILIMIIMLIIGMFLDGTAALIIMTPVFLPVVNGLGIDLVFFGVLMAINICIGTLTPPVGVCLYVSSGIAKVSIEEVTKEIVPFLIVIISALFLFVIFPQIITFLPNLLMP
jgi:C4-dicarboxylate transporter, DctM subunit